ncbi:MAG: type II toxin-antitoxin system prevent-host-death family antitoxin [Pirellulales bacterium]|nr:type II toxin-antitoxin system prevent-host-death family antitoxin [Pirellulales bacterium]
MTKILVSHIMDWMSWTVALKESVIDDLRHTMKVIPLTEAKANLSHYGRVCHDEPVIVTVSGVPAFQLVPLNEDDDLIDNLLEHNPKFRQTLQRRLQERSVSVQEARKRL